jgi:tetratricopeptide (TPR) repeat protein
MRSYIVCFFLAAAASLYSQDTLFLPESLGRVSDNVALIREYLVRTDSAEIKIHRLTEEARTAIGLGQYQEAMQKFQVALLLDELISDRGVISYKLHHAVGEMYAQINPQYALQFFQQAISIARSAAITDESEKFVLLTKMAGVFKRLDRHDSATYYHRLAMHQAYSDSPAAVISSNNNFGVYWLDREQLDSAAHYFHVALDLLKDTSDLIVLYCSIRDNLASIAARANNYQFMHDVYAFNDSVFASRGLANRYVTNKVRLMNAKWKLGKQDVGRILQAVDVYTDEHLEEVRPEERLKLYRFAVDYFIGQGNTASQARFMDKYISLRDTLEERSSRSNLYLTSSLLTIQAVNFQKDIALQRAIADQQKAKLRNARVIMFISFLTGAIIIFFMALYIKNKRQKHNALARIAAAEVKAKEMEARLAQHELELKKKDLTQVVLHNTQVHDVNQKIIERLAAIHDSKEDQVKVQVRYLLHEMEAQNRVSDSALTIQHNIDTVNAEFYKKLRYSFPHLTKAEQELCGFLRINLATKDISLLKGIEASSVKMSKNRLRKKLGISPAEDLYGFVQGI